MGIAKDFKIKDTFTRGIELIGRQTLFAEGCRGSCSEQVIERFELRSAGSCFFCFIIALIFFLPRWRKERSNLWFGPQGSVAIAAR